MAEVEARFERVRDRVTGQRIILSVVMNAQERSSRW